ncbi:hypothetical protein M5K25_026656 [Dendrobium thyrsiflorum]|uniref:Uncharacterized protein n=1 Tax=Dendrobium thyrsiflorum TaxID=117978 RepID=A0ABD0TY26_DENTH
MEFGKQICSLQTFVNAYCIQMDIVGATISSCVIVVKTIIDSTRVSIDVVVKFFEDTATFVIHRFLILVGDCILHAPLDTLNISSEVFILFDLIACRSQKCIVLSLWTEQSEAVNFLFKHSLGDRFPSSTKDIVLFISFWLIKFLNRLLQSWRLQLPVLPLLAALGIAVGSLPGKCPTKTSREPKERGRGKANSQHQGPEKALGKTHQPATKSHGPQFSKEPRNQPSPEKHRHQTVSHKAQHREQNSPTGNRGSRLSQRVMYLVINSSLFLLSKERSAIVIFSVALANLFTNIDSNSANVFTKSFGSSTYHPKAATVKLLTNCRKSKESFRPVFPQVALNCAKYGRGLLPLKVLKFRIESPFGYKTWSYSAGRPMPVIAIFAVIIIGFIIDIELESPSGAVTGFLILDAAGIFPRHAGCGRSWFLPLMAGSPGGLSEVLTVGASIVVSLLLNPFLTFIGGGGSLGSHTEHHAQGFGVHIFFYFARSFRRQIPEPMVQVSCPDVHRAGLAIVYFFLRLSNRMIGRGFAAWSQKDFFSSPVELFNFTHFRPTNLSWVGMFLMVLGPMDANTASQLNGNRSVLGWWGSDDEPNQDPTVPSSRAIMVLGLLSHRSGAIWRKPPSLEGLSKPFTCGVIAANRQLEDTCHVLNSRRLFENES